MNRWLTTKKHYDKMNNDTGDVSRCHQTEVIMNIAEITEKMIKCSDGNTHDINHFLKVWAYAKTIGELEKLDGDLQFILEVAAILHDIACPLCRVKYGNTNGKYQEAESEPLVREFLKDSGLAKEQVDRVAFLISHHHTPDKIDGIDYQILIEADYLVNTDESGYSIQNIENFKKLYFRTEAGTRLLEEIYSNA